MAKSVEENQKKMLLENACSEIGANPAGGRGRCELAVGVNIWCWSMYKIRLHYCKLLSAANRQSEGCSSHITSFSSHQHDTTGQK